ncbi:putative RDD family membrane protein YckC [Rheinheimera pacifica]|uniref:RDD family protein n=1 Tax=Rheinheimera pacifica TaxID=173990 RepID=UPI0028600F59|nr:RDD family protein [Rheinheimera pacifica]MDR6982625.1 putative RDD family membrane protein YckC [Rheinheimera pacifica]
MDNKEYAGFWIRLGAVLIDMVIIFIVLVIPLSVIYGEEYWLGDKFVYGFWDIMLSYVAPFIATIWFWLRFLGTPGKMATKLEIVDATTGNKMSTGQAIGRYFAYILAALPLGLGLIWVGIDKRKQGWHDKLAGTVVLRNTGKESVKFEEKL